MAPLPRDSLRVPMDLGGLLAHGFVPMERLVWMALQQAVKKTKRMVCDQ